MNEIKLLQLLMYLIFFFFFEQSHHNAKACGTPANK